MSEQNKKRVFTHVGMVLQKKKKNPLDPDELPKYYIKFERETRKNKLTGMHEPHGPSPFPLTINDGDILLLKSVPDELREAVKQGRMTQDTADKMSFMRYKITHMEEVDDSEPNFGEDDINF